MKFVVQELSPCKKLLDITVPEEAVSKEMKEVYKRLNMRVSIPGFRRGKAPVDVLQKLYSEQAKSEAVKKLIPDYYSFALKETNLYPLDEPSVEEINFDDNKSLTFKVEVEVRPQFDLVEYRHLRLEYKRPEVTDEMVGTALRNLQEQYAEFISVEDRPAKNEDLLIVDYEGFVDDKPVPSLAQNDAQFHLGVNLLSEDVERELVGIKKGEQRDIEITLSENTSEKNFAGKKAVLKVTVKEIKEKRLTELNDEFAKDTGECDNLEELTAIQREKIDKEVERAVEQGLKQQIAEKLLSENNVCVPDGLLNRGVLSMVEENKLYKSNNHYMNEEEMKADYKGYLIKKYKLFFILSEIAQKEGIDVSEDEINEELKVMAFSVGEESDVSKDRLEREDLLNKVRVNLLEGKVLDFLLKEADITMMKQE
ncbi:MAG: trigger factor [bacterium]